MTAEVVELFKTDADPAYLRCAMARIRTGWRLSPVPNSEKFALFHRRQLVAEYPDAEEAKKAYLYFVKHVPLHLDLDENNVHNA